MTSLFEPIEMLLWCPSCHAQHIDVPQPEKGWTNPPHRTHECQRCGHLWRPCLLATTGVTALDEPVVMGAGGGRRLMPTKAEAEAVWRKAYAARIVEKTKGRFTLEYATTLAEQSDVALSLKPEDIADDELSYWIDAWEIDT